MNKDQRNGSDGGYGGCQHVNRRASACLPSGQRGEAVHASDIR